VILSLIGFLAGITNENTVVAFWVLYFVVIVYDKVKSHQTPQWVYLTFFSYTMGFIYMIKAPSTAIRLNYYNEVYGTNKLAFIDYCNRAKNVAITFGKSNYAYIIISMLMIIIYLLRGHYTRLIEYKQFEVLGLLAVSFLSSGVLIFSPYVEIRAFLLVDFMMIVCIVYYFDLIIKTFDIPMKAIVCAILAGTLSIPTICTLARIYTTYADYNSFCLKRDNSILLSENTQSIWGSYNVENNRILNTREDYLMGNEQYLDEYFGKDIVIDSNSIYDLGINNYEKIQVMGNIDAIEFDNDYKQTYIYGWIAFCDLDYDTTEIDIYLQVNAEGQKYYYNTKSVSRKDVADELGNAEYLETGYFTYVPLEDINSVKVVIVDRNYKYYGEIERHL
jgi:hypothetical protein